ncbi:MAG: Rossmann-like domain-containing protein [bacterium]
MIKNELLDSVKEELEGRTVEDLRIGFGYTGAWLEGGAAGVSFSFRRQAEHYCQLKADSGSLHHKDALQLARFALRPHTVDSVVGMAVINAALAGAIEADSDIEGDVMKYIKLNPGEKWGMVGNFCPLVPRLEKEVDLYVFEREINDKYLYPDWAAEQYLPQMDVVILSGTTVTNNTFDRLVSLCEKAREVVLLGPSTPLAPEVMSEKGVTLLSGTVIEEPEKAMTMVSQAGGTRTLLEVSRKVNLVLK